jgi:VCBS repeat-containing protein
MLTMGICVAQDLVNIILGTIKKVDSTTKTIVVKTADGTGHTIKVTDATTLKGTKERVQRLERRNANRGTDHRERR